VLEQPDCHRAPDSGRQPNRVFPYALGSSNGASGPHLLGMDTGRLEPCGKDGSQTIPYEEQPIARAKFRASDQRGAWSLFIWCIAKVRANATFRAQYMPDLARTRPGRARKGASAKGRECQRARSAKGREVPEGANSQRALIPKGRQVPNGASRHLAHYGTQRSLGSRAVWDLAQFGTSRSLEFRAVWDFAPFGISRRSALRALSVYPYV